ncbi:MAG: hypothetical protein WAN51_12850 [Alphaproteobacteria bacterium]
MGPKGWKSAALFALAIGLAACAGDDEGPAFQVSSPPPGKALLYAMNTGIPTLLGTTRTLYDGDLLVATINESYYVILPLFPGPYVFTCGDLPRAPKVTIDARAGYVYFLQAKMGALVDRDQTCAAMTYETALTALKDMTLQRQK